MYSLQEEGKCYKKKKKVLKKKKRKKVLNISARSGVNILPHTILRTLCELSINKIQSLSPKYH